MAEITKNINGNLTPYGVHGHLHVEGKHLVDEHGKITQLKGISTHNLSCYPEYVNEKAFDQFALEYGVSIMRLAMYSANADDTDGYSDGSDEHRQELEDIIIKGVKICAKLGIYCLVDWHILFDADPNTNIEMSKHFFTKMCPLLKEYDNVILEICNEPNIDQKTQKKCTWDDIKRYSDVIIPAIREIDDSKVIIVGTPIWSQDVDTAADAPLTYANIMYTLHFYADTHKQELRDKLIYALGKNLPVFVTEFGVCNAAGDGDINVTETNTWLSLLDQNNISYIIWNLSNKNETSSLIKADVTKVSNFTDDDLSSGGLMMREFLKR